MGSVDFENNNNNLQKSLIEDKEQKEENDHNKLLLDEDFEDNSNSSSCDDNDELELSLIGSIIVLCITTIIVAIISEYLVDSINPMAKDMSISPTFYWYYFITIYW